jgi:hypothetical protein
MGLALQANMRYDLVAVVLDNGRAFNKAFQRIPPEHPRAAVLCPARPGMDRLARTAQSKSENSMRHFLVGSISALALTLATTALADNVSRLKGDYAFTGASHCINSSRAPGFTPPPGNDAICSDTGYL